MAEIQLRPTSDFPGYVLTMDIEENRCFAISSVAMPLLHFPAFITRSQQGEARLDLHLMGGSLGWESGGKEEMVVSIPAGPLHGALSDGGRLSVDLKVPLTHSQIQAIEVLRNLQDATFSVDLWVTGTCEEPSHGYPKQALFQGKGTLTIPKSIWVERILNRLTEQQFHLLQIPIPRSSRHEFLRQALEELKKAEGNLQKDYEDAVADCRKSIQPLVDEASRVSRAETLVDKLRDWSKTTLGAKWETRQQNTLVSNYPPFGTSRAGRIMFLPRIADGMR